MGEWVTLTRAHSPYKTKPKIFFVYLLINYTHLNTSLPGQNGRHAIDDIFKYIFRNEKFLCFNSISMKFVPHGPVNIKSSMVQVMAWRQVVDKPLHEAMLTQFTNAYLRHQGRWVLHWMHYRRCALVCITSNLDTFEQINFSTPVAGRRTFLMILHRDGRCPAWYHVGLLQNIRINTQRTGRLANISSSVFLMICSFLINMI